MHPCRVGQFLPLEADQAQLRKPLSNGASHHSPAANAHAVSGRTLAKFSATLDSALNNATSLNAAVAIAHAKPRDTQRRHAKLHARAKYLTRAMVC